MRRLAVPLRLGEMGETHFVLGQHWQQHFIRKAAEDGGAVTVSKLRQWTDEPRPRGLPREVQNLVILVFAEQTSRSFHLHGGPAGRVSVDAVDDALELREQELPDAAAWDLAVERAARVFGVEVARPRTVGNVGQLADGVGAKVEACGSAPDRLLEGLERCAGRLGLDPAMARLRTARVGARVLKSLEERDADPVEALARADIESAEAVGSSLAQADAVSRALERVHWEAFEGLRGLGDERQDAAARVLAELRQALEADEYVVPLAGRLAQLETEAIRLLAPRPEPGPKPSEVEGRSFRDLDRAGVEKRLAEVVARLESDPDLRAEITWKVYRGKK
jgi:hypothetical protein